MRNLGGQTPEPTNRNHMVGRKGTDECASQQKSPTSFTHSSNTCMARRTSFFAPCSVDLLFERYIPRKQPLHILIQTPLRGSDFEIAGITASISSVWRHPAIGIFEGALKSLCRWSIQVELCKKVVEKLEEMKRNSAKRRRNRQGKIAIEGENRNGIE